MNRHRGFSCLAALWLLLMSGCATSRVNSDWQNATSANTAISYHKFVQRYPASEFTDEAKVRLAALEEVTWSRAVAQHTVQAYAQFFAAYPLSAHAEELKARVSDALRKAAYLNADNDRGRIIDVTDNVSCFLEEEGSDSYPAGVARLAREDGFLKMEVYSANRERLVLYAVYSDPTNMLELQTRKVAGKSCTIYVAGRGVLIQLKGDSRRVWSFDVRL